MSTETIRADKVPLNIGDHVKHDFGQTVGILRNIRHESDGYNYLVDWQLGKGEIQSGWCKREVLVLV